MPAEPELSECEGRQGFFATPGSITGLLERLEPMGIACPVFLKIAPRDDAAERDRVLAECEAFPFFRGFCFNLPPGKPDTLVFTAPREPFVHLPGAVAGKLVESLINRCIAGLYARMDRSRYAILGTGCVVTRICRGLVDLLERDGFRHVSEAVGAAHTPPTQA